MEYTDAADVAEELHFKNKDIEQRLLNRIPQGWGKYISCGEGWYWILDALDHKLSYLDSDYELNQVKEKFGTLRFYFSSKKDGMINEIMQDCVTRAEYQSESTCEYCGKSLYLRSPNFDRSVKLREGGWVKTLCDPCDEIRKAKRERITQELI